MSAFPVWQSIGGTPSAPIFLLCDHASNAMPERYGGLGLTPETLRTHIAWDPGAGDLTRALARRFEVPAHLGGFSRLLVDPNRSLDRPDLIPEISDGIEIPGNRALPPGERHRRIGEFFEPYHQRLGYALDGFCASVADPLAVSVHTYTPRMTSTGEKRPWEVGVLWHWDEATARAFMDILGRRTAFRIGDNEPYDARVFNYTMDRHAAGRRIDHLTLEIRQDLLTTPGGVAEIAGILGSALQELLEKRSSGPKMSD